MTLSAALSFYTLLSFAPLLVLGLWLGTLLGPQAHVALLGQIEALVGQDARQVAEIIIKEAEDRPSIGSMAGVVSIVVTLVGATTLFAQLQSALNAIWNIKVQRGNAIWGWLRRRILSMGVILAFIFLLIVSLVINSLLGLFLTRTGMVWLAVNQMISLVVFTLLFALLFRYLPDARLYWRRALGGGLATALLFSIGQWLIGFYLVKSDVGGAYGAASSLVVLMVWVYYSGAVFFFGAELVQAWINVKGEKIPTAHHAEKDPTS